MDSGFAQTRALFTRFSVSRMSQAGSSLGSRRKTERRGSMGVGWGIPLLFASHPFPVKEKHDRQDGASS